MAAPVLAQPLLLGMMRLLEYPELGEPQALLGFIERCVERGLNVFDHADIYAGGQCEAHFGAALRHAATAHRTRAGEVVMVDGGYHVLGMPQSENI